MKHIMLCGVADLISTRCFHIRMPCPLISCAYLMFAHQSAECLLSDRGGVRNMRYNQPVCALVLHVLLMVCQPAMDKGYNIQIAEVEVKCPLQPLSVFFMLYF